MIISRKKTIILAGSLMWSCFLFGSDSTINKTRLKTVLYSGGGLYAAGLTGLGLIWYDDFPGNRFYFFNDNSQWKQLDKVGHVYGAYQISRAGVEVFEWTGMERKKAILYGGLAGWAFQTPIEILDGLSEEYGASWGDLVSNTLGSAMLMGQLYAWDDIRIHLKFSFFPSSYASQRPEVLGAAWNEEIIKDYNGQIYYLSFDVADWLPESSKYPKWLSWSLGYGANEMLYGSPQENKAAGYDAYRQYYLGPDINWAAFNGKSKFWNSVFFILNTIKVPAPALEYNQRQGFKTHIILY